MTESNTINIYSWMVNNLDLSQTELIVYAIIYGATNDGLKVFTGSFEYLARLSKDNEKRVIRAIKYLTREKYIEKKCISVHGKPVEGYIHNPSHKKFPFFF